MKYRKVYAANGNAARLRISNQACAAITHIELATSPPVRPRGGCCGGQCCFRWWWWAADLLPDLAVPRIQILRYPRKPPATKGMRATGTYRVACVRALQPALAARMSLRMASFCPGVLVSSSAMIE